MKVLLSADWHIKIGQKNVPRGWQIDRFRMLFSKLESFSVDLHIIAGDIFDKVPTLEELSLFFEFVSNTKQLTYIIDGNHEATKKGKTFLTEVSKICNNPNIHFFNEYTSIDCLDILPYCELGKLPSIKPTSNILVTHVRGDIPPHVKAEVDLDLFNKWELVLAGDLHSNTNSQRNILYPGSPMTTSFHRKEVENGVLIIDTSTLTSKFLNLDLPQLIRKTINKEEDMIKTDYHHTIYEIQGDVGKLSTVDMSSDILDKKIVTKSNSAVLNLANMSLEMEVEEYLLKVQQLDKGRVCEILKVLNDYTTKIGVE